MIKCDLKQINYVKHSIPLRICMHTHQADELTYFISGNGTTELNGKNCAYRAGDFAFYKKGTLHDEYDPEPCDIIWLNFSFDISGVALKEGVFHDDGKLLPILQKLRHLSVKQDEHKKILAEACLAEVIVTAAEKQRIDDSRGTLNWENILSYIDSNINQQVNFASVASANHYSYHRFRHLFTEHFGVSPYAYLTEQRILRAKLFLRNSDSSVTKIAFDCGFSSSSQFTNIFKKYVGVTPKEYRKKERDYPPFK